MTQAILLEDVDELGQRGDPVDVSPGYLRNYLIPRKLAAPATPGRLSKLSSDVPRPRRLRRHALSAKSRQRGCFQRLC